MILSGRESAQDRRRGKAKAETFRQKDRRENRILDLNVIFRNRGRCIGINRSALFFLRHCQPSLVLDAGGRRTKMQEYCHGKNL